MDTGGFRPLGHSRRIPSTAMRSHPGSPFSTIPGASERFSWRLPAPRPRFTARLYLLPQVYPRQVRSATTAIHAPQRPGSHNSPRHRNLHTKDQVQNVRDKSGPLHELSRAEHTGSSYNPNPSQLQPNQLCRRSLRGETRTASRPLDIDIGPLALKNGVACGKVRCRTAIRPACPFAGLDATPGGAPRNFRIPINAPHPADRSSPGRSG